MEMFALRMVCDIAKKVITCRKILDMLQYVDWNFNPALLSIGDFQIRYY